MELVSSSNLGGLIIVITQLIIIVTNYHEPPSSFGVWSLKTKMAIAGTKSRDFKKVQNGSVLL